LFSFAALRTPSNPFDTLVSLCVEDVRDWLAFSLIIDLPSSPSAEGFPSLFGRFIGTITSLLYVDV
jgi:hypothetical protein